MKIEFKSVVHRYSSIPGVVPTPAELIPGELALNLADSKLFTIGPSGMVIDLTAINSKFNFAGAVNGDVLTYDAITNKYVPQAPTATGTETVWTRDDPTTATNLAGIPANTLGTTLDGQNAIQILEKILYPYVSVSFSNFSVTGLATTYEIGQAFSATGNASWTAGQPTANWINGTGFISFTNIDNTVTDLNLAGFNPTANSFNNLSFPSVTPPTTPRANNTITITLRGNQNSSPISTVTASITRTWRSKMYFGKSTDPNLGASDSGIPVFDIGGTNVFVTTSNAIGPSDYSMTAPNGAGYFYLFIHDDYAPQVSVAPYFGFKYLGLPFSYTQLPNVTLTINGNSTSYKRFRGSNILNDALTITLNPTS